jgi:GT2 family glycosyltransferase
MSDGSETVRGVGTKEGSALASRTFASNSRLAVVIPIHNGLDYTRLCVRSLRSLSGPDFMLVIVDDGSTDGSGEYLRSEEPDVIVVRGSGDLWWSGGVNAGCERAIDAGAERLILLNNDNIEVSPNVVADLDRTLDEGATCACSVSMFADSGGGLRIFQTGGALDWRDHGLTLRGFGKRCGDRPQPEDKVEVAPWLPGMALAFDRSTFSRMRGFDTRRFPQYRGDADFTLRVTESGGTCVTTYRSWVINDLSQNGINFFSRATVRRFVSGLVTRRSNFQVKSVVLFAWRHCPKVLIPWHLFQFYARYTYVAVRSQVVESAIVPFDHAKPVALHQGTSSET